MAWDLSDLYAGVDDPKLDEDMARSRDETRAYMERYRGRMGGLDAAGLAQAMRELDELEAERTRLGSYAYMMFSTDTADSARGALLQRARGGTTPDAPAPERVSSDVTGRYTTAAGAESRATIQLSPDGRRLAFTAGESKSEVWMMENLLAQKAKK